jgi:mono/diheme cytochrome c family protein
LLLYGITAAAGVGLIASLLVQAHTNRQAAASAATVHPAIFASKQASIARGGELFQQNCSICHGVNGDGNGLAAHLMDPRPRDFRTGKYRFVTSGNGVPFRDDVIRTIKHGLAGTSMPGWGQLPDDDLGALADYVLSLSHAALKEDLRTKLFANSKLKPDALEKKLEKTVTDRLTPEDPVNPGPEPSFTAQDVTPTRAMFNQVCAVCHGLDGKGMQNPEWRTAENLPIASRNFRHGVFKAGGRGRDIYSRIYAGIPGTPMPSFASFKDEDIWRLVHFVQAMAAPEGEEPYVLQGPAPATQPITAAAQVPAPEAP